MATTTTPSKIYDRETIMKIDPWLEPFLPAIQTRCEKFQKLRDHIQATEGGYDAFSQGYKKMGVIAAQDGTITYREWAPNAREAVFTGEFSK